MCNERRKLDCWIKKINLQNIVSPLCQFAKQRKRILPKGSLYQRNIQTKSVLLVRALWTHVIANSVSLQALSPQEHWNLPGHYLGY